MRHGRERQQENNKRRVIESVRVRQRKSKRFGAGLQAQAVVAAGEADPAVGEAPQDFAQRERDHDEADAGRAQRKRGIDRHRYEADHQRDEDRDGVAKAQLQHVAGRVGRDAEKAGMAERHQPAVAGQHVQPERKDGIEQDLARDVDVVNASHPIRQRDKHHERDKKGEDALAHGTCLPNRPCGRSSRTSNIGRNRTK